MRVKLNVNIGTEDARRLELKATHEGDQVDVPEKVAAEMISKGWAAEVDPAKKVQGVPPQPTKADPPK